MNRFHWSQKETWQGFKGDVSEEDLLFKVQRTLNKIRRTEFKVFLAGESLDDSNASLEMKGWPFQRSCTIYKGNTIVAQVQYNNNIWKNVFMRLFISTLKHAVCSNFQRVIIE